MVVVEIFNIIEIIIVKFSTIIVRFFILQSKLFIDYISEVY